LRCAGGEPGGQGGVLVAVVGGGAAIAEGSAWLSEAVTRSGGVAGPYQIQAHLAEAHSTALSWQETDWDRIVGLYDLLGSITASPVVALNRAVAVTERDGPEAGLAALKTIVEQRLLQGRLRKVRSELG
jgi:predicted RNA polymerase sigma factor